MKKKQITSSIGDGQALFSVSHPETVGDDILIQCESCGSICSENKYDITKDEVDYDICNLCVETDTFKEFIEYIKNPYLNRKPSDTKTHEIMSTVCYVGNKILNAIKEIKNEKK